MSTNKQSLDISAINHIVKLCFHPTAVATATDWICVYHSKMGKAGHIRKRVYGSKLDFTIVKKAQVWPQPITRAILPQNQSPSVSNSQRGRRLWTDFWQLDDIFEPPGRNELIVWKTDSRFFFSRLTRPTGKGVWGSRASRAQDSCATLYRFFSWFWEKNRLFWSLC